MSVLGFKMCLQHYTVTERMGALYKFFFSAKKTKKKSALENCIDIYFLRKITLKTNHPGHY